jgi:repressor LexA
MMDDRISPRQQEFLDFMKEFEERNGHPPTFKEIAIAMGVTSKGTVSAMMASLAELGYIEKADGVSRGTHLRNPVQRDGD